MVPVNSNETTSPHSLQAALATIRAHLASHEEHESLVVPGRPQPAAISKLHRYWEEVTIFLLASLYGSAGFLPHQPEPVHIEMNVRAIESEHSRFVRIWEMTFHGAHETHDVMEFLEAVKRRRWLTEAEERVVGLYGQVVAKGGKVAKLEEDAFSPTLLREAEGLLHELKAALKKLPPQSETDSLPQGLPQLRKL